MTFKLKQFAIPVIFIAASLFLFFVLIYPTFKSIQTDSRDLVDARQKYEAMTENIRAMENFKGIYSTIEPELAKIDAQFVDASFPVSFIEFLEDIAKDTRVVINMAPLGTSKIQEGEWPFIDFRLRVSCYFPDCIKFLDKIENAPYLIEIKNFNIRKSNVLLEGVGQIIQTNAEADISLRIYTK